MSKRFLQVTGVAAVIVAVIVLLKLAPASVAGQVQTATPARAAAEAGPAPTTPWGESDLQGIWTDEFQTPLERPAHYANVEVFTEAERAELDEQRAVLPRRDARAARGTERDVRGAYNTVFESIRPTGQRTSLVVDPPDGRIPPLTPEAQNRRRRPTRVSARAPASD